MFRSFREAFPEIAANETRSVIPFTQDGPEDTFFFVELYCDEPGCDCRRVLVQVLSERAARAGRSPLLASLSYGWEPEQFYRDWASFPLDEDDMAEIKGPGLQRLAPQSPRAAEMLGHFCTLLEDAAYVERIKRHYAMFRETIGGGAQPGGLNRAQRRARKRR